MCFCPFHISQFQKFLQPWWINLSVILDILNKSISKFPLQNCNQISTSDPILWSSGLRDWKYDNFSGLEGFPDTEEALLQSIEDSYYNFSFRGSDNA